jgi:hypothetical protein
LKDGDTIRFGSVIAVFAGAYRKPCSSHGIRNFWMSISGKGAQPVAFAMASASLEVGVSRNGDFKESLVDEVALGYRLRRKQPSGVGILIDAVWSVAF